MATPAVSIVILNYNGRNYLEKFLPTVLASSYAEERVGEQVDLPDREVVGRPPIGVDAARVVGGERRVSHASTLGRHRTVPRRRRATA
ncbi:MAG: hypothetical protein ABI861_04765, partial [Panacibacter sp.]